MAILLTPRCFNVAIWASASVSHSSPVLVRASSSKASIRLRPKAAAIGTPLKEILSTGLCANNSKAE